MKAIYQNLEGISLTMRASPMLSVIDDGLIHSELKLEVAHVRQLVNRGDDISIADLSVAMYDHSNDRTKRSK